MRVTGSSVVLSLVLLGGCEPSQGERAREVVDQAARKAEEAARKASREVAEARERLEVTEKVEAARGELDERMNEAADAFAELAETSEKNLDQLGREANERLDELGEKLEYQPIEGADEAIECQGDRCTVSPELLDELAARPSILAREVLLHPARGEHGQGLALRAVKPGSVPELLGLREGDLLLELNGTPLLSYRAIRSVDEALSKADEARLVYEREGERRTLHIGRGKAP